MARRLESRTCEGTSISNGMARAVLLVGLTKAILVSRKEVGSTIGEEADKHPLHMVEKHRAVVGHMLPWSVHW